VDSDPLIAAIADQPDTFSLDGTANVTLRLINTRGGTLKNIVVSTEGDGIEVTPKQEYLQALEADNSGDLVFTITTHKNPTSPSMWITRTVTTTIPSKSSSP